MRSPTLDRGLRAPPHGDPLAAFLTSETEQSVAEAPSGRWACPVCGWTVEHPSAGGRSHQEQERLVADGWWWCAQGHEKTAVVWVPGERKGTAASGGDR